MPEAAAAKPAGHPTWYGRPFDLQDATTWGPPAETAATTHTSRRGRTYTVQSGLAQPAHAGPAWLPDADLAVHLAPGAWLDADGQSVFKRELWLVVAAHAGTN